MSAARIPVTLLTGFLGSGKTTLLNEWVQQPEFARSLIIINEFGDVSLDHVLVAHSVEQPVVELAGGCLCCTVRGDLQKTLLDARWRFARGGQRQFDRVIIETTGLADPVPIINALATHPILAKSYQWDGIIATVDGRHGLDTLNRYAEATQQVLLADAILVTKIDRQAVKEGDGELARRLRALNPSARLLCQNPNTAEERHLSTLLNRLHEQDHQNTQADDLRPVALRITKIHAGPTNDPSGGTHAKDIGSYSWTSDQMIDYRQFTRWQETIRQIAGPELLRLKGLIRLDDLPGPILIQVVQHMIHPVLSLPEWPSADHRSRIIAIGSTERLAVIAEATENMGSR